MSALKTWFIEELEKENPLKAYFDKVGRPYTLWKKFDSLKFGCNEIPHHDFYSVSLYTARKLAKAGHKLMYDDQTFKCSSYYKYYGKFLINSEYAFLPINDMARRKDWLFNTFGIEDTIWFRPDSGWKPFVGAAVDRKNFDLDIGYALSRGIHNGEMAVIASPKNIQSEWRCFVVNGKVVASSLYYERGNLTISEGCPPQAKKLAEEIAASWQPFACVVLDIGYTHEGGYGLVEMNSMASSGYYGCDIESVVHALDSYTAPESDNELLDGEE